MGKFLQLIAKVFGFVFGLWRNTKFLIIAALVALALLVTKQGLELTRSMGRCIVSPISCVFGRPDARPPEERAGPETRDNLARIIDTDTRRVNPDKIGIVRELVADAALRRWEQLNPPEVKSSSTGKKPSVSMEFVFKKALTYYPVGWDHVKNAKFGLWFDRKAKVLLQSDWLAAQMVAEKKLSSGPSPTGCATHYIRAFDNWTKATSGEAKAREEIMATMDEDPSTIGKGYGVRFFCPRKKAQ